MTPRAARQLGFTLVEVIATVMLLAIVLPAVMAGMSAATAAASDARRRSEAAGLAESKLRELTLADAWQTSASQGDFGADWPEYRWSFTAAAWDEANLTQLTLHVTWQARGQERELALATLVYSTGTSSDSSGGATP